MPPLAFSFLKLSKLNGACTHVCFREFKALALLLSLSDLFFNDS